MSSRGVFSAISSYDDKNLIKSLNNKNINARNKQGLTPLMLSVLYNNLSGMKILIDFGANVNLTALDKRIIARGSKKTTALTFIINGIFCKGLTKKNINDKDATFILDGKDETYDIKVKMFKLLLDAKADPNTQTSTEMNILHFSIFCGAAECVQLLLDHKSLSVTQTDEYFPLANLYRAQNINEDVKRVIFERFEQEIKTYYE